jgi:hypothetical protein
VAEHSNHPKAAARIVVHLKKISKNDEARATLKYNENLDSGASICELKMFGNLFLRAKII